MSLLFNMLSRLTIAFLPRSKCLLISWLQSLFAVIWEPKEINSLCFYCFPIYLPWRDRTRCHDFSSLNVEFSTNFFTLLFLIKRPFTSSSLSAKSVIFSRIFPNLGLCEASSYLSWGYTFQQNTKRDVPFSVWYIRRHIISINLWEFLGSFLNSNF